MPVVMAALKPRHGDQAGVAYFCGSACRSTVEDAALAALLEAVQSRLTFISGARDDLYTEEYHRQLRPGTEALFGDCRFCDDRPADEVSQDVSDDLATLLAAVFAASIGDVYAFPLGGCRHGFEVVQVVRRRSGRLRGCDRQRPFRQSGRQAIAQMDAFVRPIVFAGPSLHGLQLPTDRDFELAPPAGCGDLLRAARRGHSVIGLIDGTLESGPAVWHKEILFALASGCTVMGASSMGAIRAAECAAFGMIGIGQVFDDFLTGRRTADADVALIHSPMELNYAPLSVALVDVEDAVARMHAAGELSDTLRAEIVGHARALFLQGANVARPAVGRRRGPWLLAHDHALDCKQRSRPQGSRRLVASECAAQHPTPRTFGQSAVLGDAVPLEADWDLGGLNDGYR